MRINIDGHMVDANDTRVMYRLDKASPTGACIIALLNNSNNPHREVLANSPVGRARLAEYPIVVHDALVPAVWGDAPTVIDPEPPVSPSPPPDPPPDPVETIADLQRQLADLQAQMAALTGGEG